jgi:hypothetical protein
MIMIQLIIRCCRYCSIKTIDRVLVNCTKHLAHCLSLTYMNGKLLLLFIEVFDHSNEVPTVFHDYFVTNDEPYDYNARHKDNIHGYAIKTAHELRMIKYKGFLVWNNLPDYLKEAFSIRAFRKTLKYL